MQVWSLSSGSSGNCYLVREGPSSILMEAGLGVRRVVGEMAHLGLASDRVEAVLASHEHTDHWLSAAALARRHKAPLLCTSGTWDAGDASRSVERLPVVACPVTVGPFSVEAFSLLHDAREPVGWLIRSSRAAVCLVTDTGSVSEAMIERAQAADLVILEANHDVGMLVRGSYPEYLKKRILGARGHLSNEDAGRALVKIAAGRPRQYWLAHLSDANNSPSVALASIKRILQSEGLDALKLSVALRDRRSLYWDSEEEPLGQLPLF